MQQYVRKWMGRYMLATPCYPVPRTQTLDLVQEASERAEKGSKFNIVAEALARWRDANIPCWSVPDKSPESHPHVMC
jgi:hypothetical protein